MNTFSKNGGGAQDFLLNRAEEVLEICHVHTAQKLKQTTSPSTIKAENLLLWIEFMFTTEVFECFEWTNIPF